MTQLSPGPWRIQDNEYFTAILDRDGNKIAEVHVPRRPTIARPTAEERRLRIANAEAMARAGSMQSGLLV